ncbi:MAG: 3-methyl-2-oxobutanoate hydroxymethyltransferase [Actinomycetia bacterium]|nr:3-methyl-2-oxobutanoate hydroxymethyltransferase [Actinomycetes bacterium]
MPDKVTAPEIRARKVGRGADPVVMITAYDSAFGSIVDEGGVDLILVGDSVAMVALGRPDTLAVTVDEIAHHLKAVAAAEPAALIVGDLPWMSFHVSADETVRNAATLVRAGAGCVKLEGGRRRVPMVEAIIDCEIPVMGHIGLTPQSTLAFGGFRVQGRDVERARALIEDAKALEEAGCFAIVIEGVPDLVAGEITESVAIPTIGIGAGSSCDGQVLVMHDMFGLNTGHRPRFARIYTDIRTPAVDAVKQYVADVRAGTFPNDDESYHLSDEAREAMGYE